MCLQWKTELVTPQDFDSLWTNKGLKKRCGYFKEEISWLTSSWPFGETWPLICPSTWLVSCSYWILATMLFFGECTLNFKHRSFQSLPVKRQVRRLQKKSGVISGKKSNIPWWKPRDLNNKESRMFRLFRDWPSHTFKEACTGSTPVLLEKKYMAFSPSWIG